MYSVPRRKVGVLKSLCAAFATAAMPFSVSAAPEITQGMMDWRSNAADVCLDVNGSGRSPEWSDKGAEVVAIVNSSATGRSVLSDIRQAGAVICYDTQDTGMSGYYSERNNMLVLDGDPWQVDEFSRLREALTLVHEARHLFQKKVGVYSSTAHPPRETIALGKMIEADASAMLASFAYELEQQGYDVEAALSGQYEHQVYLAYKALADADPANIASGAAHRAAFDEWYRTGPAVFFYERSMLEMYENLFARTQVHDDGAYGYRFMDQGYVDRLGVLPNGVNYLNSTRFDYLADAYFVPTDDDYARRLETLEAGIVAARAAFQSEKEGARRPAPN